MTPRYAGLHVSPLAEPFKRQCHFGNTQSSVTHIRLRELQAIIARFEVLQFEAGIVARSTDRAGGFGSTGVSNQPTA